MKNSNVFRTPRLILRPIEVADQQILLDLWNRPEVRKYLWDDEPVLESTIQEMLELNERLHQEKAYGLWWIHRVLDQNEALGFVGLWHFLEESEPQLVYGLKGDFWRQGYATESSSRIIEFAFSQLQMTSLRAATDPPNVNSVRVLDRLGFRLIEKTWLNGLEALVFRLDGYDWR